MPFNEATFWIGLTVAGTGLYFWIEGETRRRVLSIVLTAIGLLAVVYSVYLHDHPSSDLRVPVWIWLLALTWLALAYDISLWRRALIELADQARQPKPTVEMLEAARKEQVAKREHMIASCRKMVREVNDKLRADKSLKVADLLDSHRHFYGYRPFMSKRTMDLLSGKNFVTYESSIGSMDSCLASILQDVDTLAKEWGVI